jgi:hypothetical protein
MRSTLFFKWPLFCEAVVAAVELSVENNLLLFIGNDSADDEDNREKEEEEEE